MTIDHDILPVLTLTRVATGTAHYTPSYRVVTIAGYDFHSATAQFRTNRDTEVIVTVRADNVFGEAARVIVTENYEPVSPNHPLAAYAARCAAKAIWEVAGDPMGPIRGVASAVAELRSYGRGH